MASELVLSQTRKWHRHSDVANSIASIMTSGHERYAKAVESLFDGDYVAYSGIVLSNNQDVADGEGIEKSCYSKGGLKFLYRSYTHTNIDGPDFPISQLASMLENLAMMYLIDVVGARHEKSYLDACWAVCQREGDYGTLHNHVPPDERPGSRYSGMFYLQTPPTINPRTFPDGCLHLITPDGVVYVPPIPGSVTLWPSQLLHGIHPFKGSGDRLGIAFDIVSRKEQGHVY